jgi:parvulin-like peptidyl-prolyl isomerase
MSFAEKSGIKNDPKFQKMVAECQKGVLQKLFLDAEIKKRATDEKLKEAYDQLVKSAPKGVEEYDISMITVTDKKKAKEILDGLKKSGPAKFAEVANKESMNKVPDGNMGYVRLEELPPAVREKVKGAAKATIIPTVIEISMRDPGEPNKEVTTHSIILVKDKRPATLPPFDAVRGELEASIVGPKVAKEVIAELEGKAKIELFTKDGKPLDQKADAPKVDADKADASKMDAPKADAPKASAAAGG